MNGIRRQEILARTLNRMPTDNIASDVVKSRKYTCPICDEKFDSPVAVRHHKRKDHDESTGDQDTIGGPVRSDKQQ